MKKVNSLIKLSNNLSFVILIFAILKFQNADSSTFRRSKFKPPLNVFNSENQNFASKIRNFEIFYSVDIAHYSQFCQF